MGSTGSTGTSGVLAEPLPAGPVPAPDPDPLPGEPLAPVPAPDGAAPVTVPAAPPTIVAALVTVSATVPAALPAAAPVLTVAPVTLLAAAFALAVAPVTAPSLAAGVAGVTRRPMPVGMHRPPSAAPTVYKSTFRAGRHQPFMPATVVTQNAGVHIRDAIFARISYGDWTIYPGCRASGIPEFS